jgi:hypothetical protein
MSMSGVEHRIYIHIFFCLVFQKKKIILSILLMRIFFLGSYRDLVTNVQYELAEAINEGLVYATIIETKEDTEMLTSSLQEIIKKFIVRSVAVDSDSQEKIGGLEAQAVGILNYAQGVYHDRKYGVKIPLGKKQS